MGANKDPMAQARETVGFFRVLIDHLGEIGYSSSYLADGAVTSECSTRAKNHTFIAIAWPTPFAPAPGPQLHHEPGVDVFLDGAFVQRSSWRKTDEAWTMWFRVDNNVRVTVSIIGRVVGLPSELALIRDTPPA